MTSTSNLTGTELRLLRQRRNLSQAKLALLLDVPQAHLSQWELEKIPVTNGIAGKVHSLLGNLDDGEVARLRKKRYQRHEYIAGGNGEKRCVPTGYLRLKPTGITSACWPALKSAGNPSAKMLHEPSPFSPDVAVFRLAFRGLDFECLVASS